MKNKFIFLSAILVFHVAQIFSQALTVSSPQLNFGTAFENAPDSLQLTISNSLNRDVSVNEIRFYDTYGVPAFSASEQNFIITSSSSYNIWVKFSPRHNIFHNSEMVIMNDGLRGYTNVDLNGQGVYSNSYYDSTENLSEENLKTVLHNITGTGYVSLTYNPGRDSMFMSIDNKKVNGQGDTVNTIECIYTGREAVGYIDRTDCQTNFSFNTEHTFPQSFFASAEPMKSDLHHLFPTDDAANNYRADNPFGIVTSPTWSVGGSKATTTLFEPRDEQKGKAARALMYFVLRYQNYSNFFTPQESILRTWHHDFPPDTIEQKRNNDIGLVQHNRNPFVDYPQFIERINSISSTSVAPTIKSIDLTQDTIIYGFVQQGTPAVFHFVIVNNGNTDVQFSNFTLSQPELSFQSGGANSTLAAGEALTLDLKLLAQNNDSIHAFLNFNTDDPSHSSVSVPVYVNDSVFSNVNEIEGGEFEVFPNPVKDKLIIHDSQFQGNRCQLKLFDTMGREIFAKEFSSVNCELSASNLLSGIYFLKITSGEKIFFRKFVKE